MVDGEGYKTTYQYLDNTEPSQVSVGRWSDHLGATESYYNKGKALPLMLRFCWDSIIDKKSYETLIFLKRDLGADGYALHRQPLERNLLSFNDDYWSGT